MPMIEKIQGRQRIDTRETFMKGTEVEKRKQKTLIDIENKNQFCTLEFFYISLILH
jgi:hypothetical protein